MLKTLASKVVERATVPHIQGNVFKLRNLSFLYDVFLKMCVPYF